MMADVIEFTGKGWRARLIKKDGKPAKISANVVTFLREHPDWKGVLAYDLFAERVLTLKRPPWDKLDAPKEWSSEWTDADTGRLVAWLARKEKIEIGKDKCDSAVQIAAEAQSFHPVRDYLSKLVWDQKPRLEMMLSDFFGAKDTPYTRGVSLRWPISAVARVMQPGCQADCTIVLESKEQGTGKSTALEALAGSEWFADTSVTVGDKDSYQNLRGIWIYELGELDSVRKAETTKVKNFLSPRSDRYRPSFGTRSRDFKRQNVFAGTTNEEQYLADWENRRYWPVRVVAPMRVAELKENRDQIWAEALRRYSMGERWHVDTPQFHALCKSEQEERISAHPLEPVVATWLKKPTSDDGARVLDLGAGVTTSDVLIHCLHKRLADIERGDENLIAGILRRLGWAIRHRTTHEGIRAYRYFTTALYDSYVLLESGEVGHT